MKMNNSAPLKSKQRYRYAPMELGFVVVSCDGDPSRIGFTKRSIQKWYGDVKTIAVVPEAHQRDCPDALTSGNSITSMINVGMNRSPGEWNVVVLAGVTIKEKLNDRYSFFMENRRDIFFPLVWGKMDFVKAPLNGLAIHRETFAEVGPFATDNSLELCKLMWFLEATDRGCKFKGIQGTRMA